MRDDTRENTREAGRGDGAYDVVVVGGGTGGLSAALILGRSRRSVLVVDAGEPRNAPAAHMHGFPSRDGTPPAEFLAELRREIAAYGVELLRDRVTAAGPDGAGEFDVRLAAGGAVHARRLVVATGLVDELPDLPGVAELWGSDVLHCPFCHGWEVRDLPIGVLYRKESGLHQTLLFSHLSDDVTLFLDGAEEDELPDTDWRMLAAAGVSVVRGRVGGLESEDGRLAGVRLTDGRFFPRTAFAVPTRTVPRDGVLTALGARTRQTPAGAFVDVDPTGLTSVPGVWAVGNATGANEQVVNAASAGYRAGLTLHVQLLHADLEQAAAQRGAGTFTPDAERAVAARRVAARRGRPTDQRTAAP
ncbi:NAD(P)/FAD-dependent oxidoreductase [Streptomyces beihaiensis]|uniref:NAD(P)/FAD-dependent oxidoreductase n=1 Tax=Streptomyces beihaiensis TaxID=2984495 RepID=A0ABT3TW09_9ACTN|nr:NAD(P)/FAD-dependent oxidoreductase [Streptomyces beihaiensis]MCX3061233.1 NAD(P)/FAD-dependent oxidoreductase [Streptomyces beihaiensis]